MYLHIKLSGLGCLIVLAVIAGVVALIVWGAASFPAVAICVGSVAVIALMIGALPR